MYRIMANKGGINLNGFSGYDYDVAVVYNGPVYWEVVTVCDSKCRQSHHLFSGWWFNLR